MLLLPVCLACLGLTPLTAAAENGASPENSAGAPGAESAAEHPGNAKSGATSDTSGADANPQGGPKVLVIYYSYSGNTKIVAERLREKTGGDIYAVETERRFYLCNSVDVKVRNDGGEVYFDVTMTDAWVWDIYRPARFAKRVRVVTFKDVNVEELAKPDLELPKGHF